jgi:CRISPR-associated endoribonuclease Cas6
MRIIVNLRPTRPVTLPVNCQDLLQATIYRLLHASDTDYTRFLHDEGYTLASGLAAGPRASKFDPAPPTEPLDPASSHEHDGAPTDSRRFKLFAFSGLRAAPHDRRIVGDLLHLASGSAITWQISSPLADFLTHCANGLLTAGALRVGTAELPIESIAAVPTPAFDSAAPTASREGADSGLVTAHTASRGVAAFTCLTPIVAAVPAPDGRTTPRYLRPTEGDAFSDAVRNNLLAKYRIVHGHPPTDDRLRLTFNAAYLARNPHAGTKKITFRQIDLVGALAPFTLEASPDLLALAWEAGLGQGNSMGFGLIETDARGAGKENGQ